MAPIERRSPNKWLVLTIVYIILLVQYGLLFAIGATFVAMLDKFHLDRSRTAMVQSLFLGLGLSLGVVGGVLVERIGLLYMSIISSMLCPVGFIVSFYATSIEFLCISIGVISGTGVSFANMCSSTALVRAFTDKELALYLSIAYSAPGLAGVIYPYFIDWSLNMYGLNGTWLLIGGLYLNSWPLPLLIILNRQTFETRASTTITVRKADINKKCRTTKHIKDNHQHSGTCGFIRDYISIFKNMPFTFRLIGTSFTTGCINGYTSLILDIAAWKTFSSSQALFLFVPYSVCNMVSRILAGLIKQKRGINSYIYPIILIIFGIIALFINHFTINFGIFACGISLIGLSKGGPSAAGLVVAIKLVEKKQHTVASGLMFTFHGLFSTAPGPLFGAIPDISGSYELVTLATIVFLSTGLMCLIISLVLRKVTNKDRQALNENQPTVTPT